MLADEGEVGLLVGRVFSEQLLPPARQAQQLLVQCAQSRPGLFGPWLVEVVGQQWPGVHRQGPGRCFGGTSGEGGLPGPAELDRVRGDL